MPNPEKPNTPKSRKNNRVFKADSRSSRDGCRACTDSDPGVAKKTSPETMAHPDHFDSLTRLKRIQGQLSGIERMIHDRRYCFDILTQLRAVSAAMQAVETSVFERHLKMCVKQALESKSITAAENKIQELLTLLRKRPYESQ
jgi:DNA-binding FrmR family transcriptional regulator